MSDRRLNENASIASIVQLQKDTISTSNLDQTQAQAQQSSLPSLDSHRTSSTKPKFLENLENEVGSINIGGQAFIGSKIQKNRKLKAKNLKKIYENKLAVLNQFKEKYEQNIFQESVEDLKE